LLYTLHYRIFHDSYFLRVYILDHLAFLPVEILMVSIFIGSLLSQRERNQRLDKLNMVTGAFFSEMGRELLVQLSAFDAELDLNRCHLLVKNTWTKKHYLKAQKSLKCMKGKLALNVDELDQLRSYLMDKRQYLLTLMENPYLLEHDKFTDLMQALFHLLEELQYRTELKNLPASDIEHLLLDAKRVYIPLMVQWLDHLQHLRSHYPYLYSLSLRTNPFDPQASVIVR
jgi:hypothetical protein